MKKEIIIGIYKITSPSKKVYIGQSIDIIGRWNKYRHLHCKAQTKLYHSFLNYGVDKHKFEIIHECNREQLNELEVYYIELFQCFNSKYGLNLMSGGNVRKCSDETRYRISINNKGKKLSEEAKLKMSKSRKGVPLSEEHKLKIRISNTNNVKRLGKRMSDETKEKLRQANYRRKYKPTSEETKLKLSLGKKGKKLPEEWRNKIAAYMKTKIGTKRDMITIMKISNSLYKPVIIKYKNGIIINCKSLLDAIAKTNMTSNIIRNFIYNKYKTQRTHDKYNIEYIKYVKFTYTEKIKSR